MHASKGQLFLYSVLYTFDYHSVIKQSRLACHYLTGKRNFKT